MSFLNSVLNSINGGKRPVTAPHVNAPPKDPPADRQPTEPGVKRKASSELSRPNEKIQKGLLNPATRVVPTTKPLPPSIPSSSNVSTQKASKLDAAKPAIQNVKAPPKKGSFAEVLARAKQNSTMQVGQLTHKAKGKEKLSTKKELLLQREQARLQKKGKHEASSKSSLVRKKSVPLRGNPASNGRQYRKEDARTTQETAAVKNRPQPTYQGTMKPRASQPAYRGTIRTSTHSHDKRGYDSEPDRVRTKATQQRRGGYSDYDSGREDDSEDGYDYASDDYSDMDAGFEDVDEEEAAAEREAKKEDMKEQRMLDELARQKEERKKRVRLAGEREKAFRH